jgi:hypothetical protein
MFCPWCHVNTDFECELLDVQLLLDTYLPELEQLKLRIATREKEGNPMQQPVAGMTQDTVQLVTGNLPELSNWGAPSILHVTALNSLHPLAPNLIRG